MIKRIELVNFMSHERTVIEPADGLTVLIGPNNCGKSAFVAALQILCHNAKSNYVMRHGEKKCEIVVETDDGHVIQWSRTKSGSPKYVIDDQEFDRLKGGVPKELHEILGLGKVACEKDQFDVHFGEQKSPVFLLNDSGKASAQFFASSSDAIRLVEMQDRHKGKVRDAKRDQLRLTTESNQISEALERLDPVVEIESRLSECEQAYTEIQELENSIEQAAIVIRAIADLQTQFSRHQAAADCLEELLPPPQLDDEDRLARLIKTKYGVESVYASSKANCITLERLEHPPELVDLDAPRGLLDSLNLHEKELARTTQTARTFSLLGPVPTIEDESELELIASKLVACHAAWLSFEKKTQVLGRLTGFPELTNQNPLDSLLDDTQLLSANVQRSGNELQELKSLFNALNLEITQWVDENPNCPTCGGETKIEQLITGGHQHG